MQYEPCFRVGIRLFNTPVDVEKEDIRFLFTNADMETTRAP
jgi:hypothetical protein